jgi:serine/threonine-protein kinase
VPERFIGRTFGRYRVDALIGSGGFAWVYRAFDPELEIPVALKVLKPLFAGDEAVATRFRREASTAARLRHPNIINILSVGREHGTAYFSMDLLPDSLAQRLEAKDRLAEPELLRMGIDVARALAFAHRQGVIHRDVKVDNILFDEHGNAIVADFGIARAMQEYAGQTGANMVMGTPQYFSPEQARGRTLDGRSDIYSLGVTLFRAATGTLPFDDEDWYSVARRHVEQPPPSPRTLAPAISEELEAIILRCLRKDPGDRYATADDVATSLERCLRARVLARETPAASAVTALASIAVRLPAVPTGQTPTSQTPDVARDWSTTVRATAFAIIIVLAVSVALFIRPGSSPPSPGGLNGRGRTEPGTSPSRTPRESAASAQARFAALTVSVPPNAQIAVDGRAAGAGLYRSDSLPPGAYRLAAMVPTLPGCVSSMDSITVSLVAGQHRVVELHPSPCGSLSIAARIAGKSAIAAYVLVRSTSPDTARGDLPMGTALVLPVGDYDLTIDAQGCRTYRAKRRLDAGVADTIVVPLLCGPG